MSETIRMRATLMRYAPQTMEVLVEAPASMTAAQI